MKVENAQYIGESLVLRIDGKQAIVREPKPGITRAGYVYLLGEIEDTLPETVIPATADHGEYRSNSITNDPVVLALTLRFIGDMAAGTFSEGSVPVPGQAEALQIIRNLQPLIEN